jgi:hypothetical protein
MHRLGAEYITSQFLGPLAENTIAQIARNDEAVLECIEKAIAILGKDND